MVILYEIGDGIKGERIACEFRKLRGPYLIVKTHAHRAQHAIIIGLPAEAWIEKPIKIKEK